MILFDHVSKRYGPDSHALHDISFQIEQGEMVFVTGRSGAGKSTLLKLVPLLEQPSGGRIVVNGQSIGRLSRRRIPLLRRQFGMIFQNHRLLNDRTVFDNVALPLILSGTYEPPEISRRVRAALDKVGLLHKEKAIPETLSSGEQQRVGIARAVVNRPLVLLADEPTGNLDPELSGEIFRLFEKFNQLGVTVVIASHDLTLIDDQRHRVLVLRGGRLVGDSFHDRSGPH